MGVGDGLREAMCVSAAAQAGESVVLGGAESKSVGKVVAGCGGVGLAMVRLEYLSAAAVDNGGFVAAMLPVCVRAKGREKLSLCVCIVCV